MEKPTKKRVVDDMIDYHEMIDFIEKKYDINTHDYAGRQKRVKKYEKEFDVNLYASPQCYGGKYYAWINGEKVEVDSDGYHKAFEKYYEDSKKFVEWEREQGILPYLDYWHWLIDNEFFELNNPSKQTISVTNILENEDNPKWVQEITQFIYDEFKNELNEDGELEVWIEW